MGEDTKEGRVGWDGDECGGECVINNRAGDIIQTPSRSIVTYRGNFNLQNTRNGADLRLASD